MPARGKVNRLSLLDAAYLAGFVDGEGTITISKSKERKRTCIRISNTNKEIMDWIKETVGNGHILTRTWNNKRWKNSYEYSLDGGNRVKELVCQIFPFLKIKKIQATLVLGFPQLNSGRGFKSLEENKWAREVQDLLYDHSIQVNQRGNIV
jgi:hypothetical protein